MSDPTARPEQPDLEFDIDFGTFLAASRGSGSRDMLRLKRILGELQSQREWYRSLLEQLTRYADTPGLPLEPSNSDSSSSIFDTTLARIKIARLQELLVVPDRSLPYSSWISDTARDLPPEHRELLTPESLRPLFEELWESVKRLQQQDRSIKDAYQALANWDSLILRLWKANSWIVDEIERRILAVEAAIAELETGASHGDKPASATEATPVLPIVLGGPADEPTVRGKEKKRLTPGQYRVVKALLDAHPERISKDALATRSDTEDPVGMIDRLRKDPDWAGVLDKPGQAHGGYGIRVNPPRKATPRKGKERLQTRPRTPRGGWCIVKPGMRQHAGRNLQ